MIRFILNEQEIATELPPGTLLLDFIRYHQHLMGTKIGCREGDCGACTVLVGELKDNELVYRSATSCLMAIGNAAGKHIVTIEGLNVKGLNPIQQAFANEGASQCGFCTPGFIVSLAGFCLSKKEPTYQQAIASIDGNICRCTGYKSIERATATIANILKERKQSDPVSFATAQEIIPAYFSNIQSRLQQLTATGVSIRSENNGRKLGGGTDLYVQQPEAMTHADIDFLFDKNNYQGVWNEGSRCFIGGAATVTDFFESPVMTTQFPQLDKFMKLVSSTQIRNMATIAGNIVNASPIGDFTIFLLALDAQIVLFNGTNEREVPLRNFYRGYKQLEREDDETVRRIWFNSTIEYVLFNFEKVSKRTHLDIATVNSACAMTVRQNKVITAGLSAGGVGPVPMYLHHTSAFLEDKEVNEDVIAGAIELAQKEISPISDVRGSAAYKRLLLAQLIKAHFIELFPELKIEKMINT